jgi:hypothetical protein
LVFTVILTALGLVSFTYARDANDVTTETKKQMEESHFEHQLEMALKHEKDLDQVIIEVQANPVSDGFKTLTIYGRGLGIWESSKQFELKEKKVRQALKLFKTHDFFSLPERAIGPAPTPASSGPASNARLMLVRSVTLTIGSISKTTYQDNKTFESPQLRDLVHELGEIGRKSARKGTGCSSLDSGLKMIADGTLAPETLSLTASAPEMRNLPSQDGQGWMLKISHARVEANSHDLSDGWAKPLERPLDPTEAEKLVTVIAKSGFPEMPINLKAPGYTDVTITVLNHHHQIQAREFAREMADGEETFVKDFLKIRGVLHSLWEKLND